MSGAVLWICVYLAHKEWKKGDRLTAYSFVPFIIISGLLVLKAVIDLLS